MRSRSCLILVASTIAVVLPAAFAHHSPAPYNLQARLRVEGRVARVQWANPHVYIYLETETAAGETVTWQIEADAPSNMERHGWYRESLVSGEYVTAQAFPGRNADARIAKLFGFIKADGTRLSYIDPALLDRDSPASVRAEGLAGIWAPDPLRPDSAAARLQDQLLRAAFGLESDVPLTAAGLDAMQAFEDEVSPTVQCVPRTAPSTTMYSSGLQSIEIREDVVVLRENWFGTERTVRLDADSHEGAGVAIQGHSIGRWEGDELVVDSARFTEHREGLFNRLPSSRAKHLVERFSLDTGADSLTYEWELTDPEYLTETVTGANRWTYRPDLEFSTVACDPDSATRFLQD